MRLSVTASTRNWSATSAERAPVAMRSPISRVRSGDRHEHDVHDADAADDERHAGDAREQRSHRVAGAIEGVGHFLEGDFIELRQIRERESRGGCVQPLREGLRCLCLDREIVGRGAVTALLREVVSSSGGGLSNHAARVPPPS